MTFQIFVRVDFKIYLKSPKINRFSLIFATNLTCEILRSYLFSLHMFYSLLIFM